MKHKRWLSMLLALVMVLVLLPTMTIADGTDSVNYIDADGNTTSVSATTLTESTTDMNTGWYAVTGNITNNNRISVNGDVNLILCDGATLTAPKGISANGGNSLTIWGQVNGTGALTINIDDESDENLHYLAGIGGDGYTSSGTITINGGTVTAKGGTMAAGIGGGHEGDGTVVINGGTVTATGGDWGAGIGGGQRSRSKGGYGAVTITGGNVTAKGGVKAAGIGGGFDYDASYGSGSIIANASVTISGGVINAAGDGNYGGVGIGGSGATISLNWTSGTDSITSTSYRGTVTLNKGFTDGENSSLAGTVSDVSSLANKTLTPLYRTITYTHGAGSGTDYTEQVGQGSSVNMPACNFNAPAVGYKFCGWKVTVGEQTSVTAQPGDAVTVAENTVAEAQWTVAITCWADLQNAIDNAGDGETIILIQDINAEPNDVQIKVKSGKNVILDLNGNTLNRKRTSSDSNGHVIQVYSGGTLTIKDSSANNAGTITGGWATNGGGINNQGTLIIQGGTFAGNQATNGGAVFNYSELTITGGRFMNNQATYAGAIYNTLYNNTKATMTVEGGTFCGNMAVSGGAILNHGTMTVERGTFDQNVITGGGGAIWTDGTATITEASITNNTGAINGGAIANHGRTMLNDCLIQGNTASAAGGAIFTGNNGDENANAKVTVTGGIIMENSAPLGGGIYIDSDTVELYGAAVMENTASDKGGGVYVNGSRSISQGRLYTRDNAAIVRNTAGDGGGIYIAQGYEDLYLYTGLAELRDTLVSENTTTVHGGGGITNYGYLILNNCQIEDNTAVGKGGGIFTAYELTVTDSTIGDNTTDSDGGGIYVGTCASAESDVLITGGTISGNEAVHGGGICTCEADPEVENVIVTIKGTSSITDNTASEFGGGICNDAKLILKDSVTVTGNTSVGCGGGIWTASDLQMQDKIVVKDNTGSADDLYLKNSQCITLTGALDAASSIGLSFEVWDAVLTYRYATYNANTDPTSIFTAQEGYAIYLDESDHELHARHVLHLGANILSFPYDKDHLIDYYFTPEVNGTYLFYSVGDQDTYIFIHNGNQYLNDDNSGEGNNFRLTTPLSAGASYPATLSNYTSDAYVTVYVLNTNPHYTVTIADGIENGVVTSDVSRADAGQTVTLTVTQKEGYLIDTVSYNDGSDHEITPVKGTYRFIMPAGNVTVTATFKEDDTKPRFKGHQLVLSGQIGMYFYISIPEGMTDGTMSFTVGDRTVTADGTLQSDGRYKFTCYVNSVEMAEEITATYTYTADGESKTVTDTTSVKEYLEIIINNEQGLAEYTAAAPLAKSIYNYGYYAMQAVPGGSKHPAMPDTYTGEVTLITSLDDYAISATLDTDVITKASYSLDLESETAINFYLTTDSELSKDNVSVTAPSGTTFNYTVEKVGSRYRVQITGIGAHELGTVFTLRTGNTTISASAMTYVQQRLANANASEVTKNAAAALYAYYQEAINYRNSNN